MSDIFNVTVTPLELQLHPGVEVQATIAVQNAGYLVDSFSIEVLELDSTWYRLSASTLSLFPGDEDTSTLFLSLPVDNQATARVYDFQVRVTSINSPEEQINVPVSLEVQPVYALDLNIRPEKVTGKSGDYQINIDNTSNSDLAFSLVGSDPEEYCNFFFEPEQPVVPPRSAMEVGLTVRPRRRRRPVYGRPKTFNLTITATPDKTPETRTLHAQLDAVSYIKWWHVPVAVLALLAVMVIIYSAFWAVVLRDSWTYLGAQTWDAEMTFDNQLVHGQIYPFRFNFNPDNDQVIPPQQLDNLKLTIDVIWPELQDVSPSVQVILRSPDGKCSPPENVGRTDAPFPHSVNSESSCESVQYGELLMDLTNQDAPKPAVYNYGDPIIEYCVSNLGNENETVIYDGPNPKPYSNYRAAPSDNWTLYLVNDHPNSEKGEVPPRFATVRMKASNESGNPPPGFFFLEGKRKHRDYTVELTQTPLPNQSAQTVAASTNQCGTQWDSQLALSGKGGQGIEHGTVFVRKLQVAARQGTPPQSLQKITIDATWEQLEEGKVTADRSFIVLRDGQGNCWSTVQGQTSENGPETIFEFPVATEQLPCRQQLSGQLLWNLINWNLLEPAGYEGVQPLVRFCRHSQGTTLFGDADALPQAYAPSWQANTTQGWNLYIINPNFIADPPLVTVKVRGDEDWKVVIIESADANVGDAPLVPASTCRPVAEELPEAGTPTEGDQGSEPEQSSQGEEASDGESQPETTPEPSAG